MAYDALLQETPDYPPLHVGPATFGPDNLFVRWYWEISDTCWLQGSRQRLGFKKGDEDRCNVLISRLLPGFPLDRCYREAKRFRRLVLAGDRLWRNGEIPPWWHGRSNAADVKRIKRWLELCQRIPD